MCEVSVIMPSYNHGAFILKAVHSVLNQTYRDFEFLISDDGSTDNTHEILRSIDDPRVRLFLNKENRGAAIVHSELVQLAKGNMVALINSDDTWRQDKLEKQVSFLKENRQYSAYFSNVNFIDENEQNIDEKDFAYYNVFKTDNKSRGEWLRSFFLQGNSLCHPSSMIYKSVYDKIGFYDNSLRQLPDYYQWIKLCKHFEFFVSNERLINFRVLGGENASAPTTSNNIRVLNEHLLIANRIFDDVEPSLFREAFLKHMKRPDLSSDLSFEIEKAFIYFTPVHTLSRIYRVIGLQRLYELLSQEETKSILKNDYGFDQRTFHALMGERSPFINDDILITEADVNVNMMSFRALVNVLRTRARRRLKARLKF